MNTTSLVLTSILTIALVIIIAPNIFAMNRGKALQNIAIWLAVFAVLGLIYQYFGPDSPHPLFNQPEAMQGMQPMKLHGKNKDAKPEEPGPDVPKSDDAHDYAPPKEE